MSPCSMSKRQREAPEGIPWHWSFLLPAWSVGEPLRQVIKESVLGPPGPLLSFGIFLGPSPAVKPSLPSHPIVCSLVRKQEDVFLHEVGKMVEGTLKGLYGGLLSWTEGEPDFSNVAN